MRRRERERFVRLCRDLIAGLGGVPTDEPDRWHLETRHGLLTLRVAENTVSGPGTVFTRFDDPGRASPHTGCNPHSGKWNMHYFGSWTVAAALADVEGSLRSVLPEQQTA